MFKSKEFFNEVKGKIYVEMSKYYHYNKDYENSFKYACLAEECGNKESILLLSNAYQNGEGVKKDLKKAFEILAEYADQKELDEFLAIAQFNLSVMYAKGIGTEVNLEKSMEYIKKSADNGFTTAQHTYGYFLEKGQNGLKADKDLAEKYYTKAAFNGHVDAQCNLVMLLANGEDSEKYTNKIIYWLTEATENGKEQTKKYLDEYKQDLGDDFPSKEECEEAVAQDYRWVMKEDIERIERYKERAKLYKKECNTVEFKKELKQLKKLVNLFESLDVDEEDKDSIKDMMVSLYEIDYFDDIDFDYDDEEEQEEYEENEELEEQGLLNERNESKEVRQLITKGYELIQRGHKKEGFELWCKAYEMGSLSAAYNLAQCYDRGEGVERDAQKGFELFYQCANYDEVCDVVINSQFNIGNAYFTANGVERDYQEAFYWYERAADNGHAVAQYNMALCYFNGNHLPINFNLSFHYASKSVSNGFAQAIPLLATLYFTGKGTEKDIEMAKKLYSIAAAQGDRGAKQVLETILADEEKARKEEEENN